jgi:hypothetical protein
VRIAPRLAVAAALTSVVLLLGACSGSSGSGTTSLPAPDLSSVVVTGEVGSRASIALPSPSFALAESDSMLVADGTGAELVTGQQLLIQETAFDGTGALIGTTYETGPESLTFGTVPELEAMFAGAHVGARGLAAIVAQDSTTFVVVDVVDGYDVPAEAQGEIVAPVAGLPAIEMAATGPAMTPVADDAPTALVVQDLITGSGPVVEAGQMLTVNYSGWLWDGTAFDSSWTNGQTFTTPIGQGAVIPGWDTGLVGQTVGSRVLLVIPPDQAYGDQESGAIPAGSTLVFVVDILAARSVS